jgi:hypothetical protein
VSVCTTLITRDMPCRNKSTGSWLMLGTPFTRFCIHGGHRGIRTPGFDFIRIVLYLAELCTRSIIVHWLGIHSPSGDAPTVCMYIRPSHSSSSSPVDGSLLANASQYREEEVAQNFLLHIETVKSVCERGSNQIEDGCLRTPDLQLYSVAIYHSNYSHDCYQE